MSTPSNRGGSASGVQVAEMHDMGAASAGRSTMAATSAARSMSLAAVAVAVDRQQHLRLDLGQPVDHRRDPELGRTARPDGADRRRRQQRDERLGDVRGVGDDSVTALDTEGAEPGRHSGHVVAQLGPRQLGARARLAAGGDGDVVGALVRRRERVLGVVEGAAREPAHTGHHVAVAHGVRPVVPPHPQPVDHLGPELVGLGHRPLVQRRRSVANPWWAANRPGFGAGGRVVRRRPQDLAPLGRDVRHPPILPHCR